MSKAEKRPAQRSEHRCLGPDCAAGKLIKAHIMPAGFARAMHRPDGYNLGLKEDGARRAHYQLGAFDTSILCRDCDGVLGRLDDFALTFCINAPPHPVAGTIGHIPDTDCDKLAAFVISLIWRASISRLPEFAEIDLGPLARRARDLAFARSTEAFPVIANRLTSERFDVREFYVQPTRWRIKGLNAYSVLIGGFQFFMFADSRPIPRGLQQLVINGRRDLASLTVPLEGTTEFAGMREIADRQRRITPIAPTKS